MVEGFTGLPGSGKTYYLTKLGLEALKQGRKVYANFKIEGANYFQNLTDVFNLTEGVILVDEINLSCASRFWAKFPPELAYFWSQTRKFKLDIYWTAQHIDRVDKIIREITNYAWTIKKLPFGIFLARQFLPEHITKEKRYCYQNKFFILNKKIYTKYNTYELIKLPDYLTKRKEALY